MSHEEGSNTTQQHTPRSIPAPPSPSRMSPARKVLWGVAGLTLGILLQPIAAQGAQAVDAFITNDAKHPVPVTGSVNVGNLPATTTVEVANNDPIPVTQAPPTEQVTFTRDFDANRAGSACNGNVHAFELLYTVPAGRQFVVDHVSVSLSVLSNGYHRVWLRIGRWNHFIPTSPSQFDVGLAGFGVGFAQGADDPNVTVDAGEGVWIGMDQRWNNGLNNTCSTGPHYVTLVGHLVG
jgi:hypothetical protein